MRPAPPAIFTWATPVRRWKAGSAPAPPAGGFCCVSRTSIPAAAAEFAAAIEEDLAWLGLDWDGPVRVQSRHLPEYEAVLDALAGRGLLYPCFCTRADIAAAVSAPHQAPDGGMLYPGTCRRLSHEERFTRVAAGSRFALRLDIARAMAVVGTGLAFTDVRMGVVSCDPMRFGDVVLARKDAPASYHLCVTHDDAVQGVTCVTRGEDLLAATDIHRLLQALMGWPEPLYAHHPLLTDAQGRRFAKRDGAVTLRQLRADGMSPAAARTLAMRERVAKPQ